MALRGKPQPQAQIRAAVLALGEPSVREIAERLWPGTPWLPTPKRLSRTLRGTVRVWPVPAPLPDGRTSWEATAAMWLYRECEVMVKRGDLEHASIGETPIIDILTTTRYRVATTPPEPPAPRRRGRKAP